MERAHKQSRKKYSVVEYQVRLKIEFEVERKRKGSRSRDNCFKAKKENVTMGLVADKYKSNMEISKNGRRKTGLDANRDVENGA